MKKQCEHKIKITKWIKSIILDASNDEITYSQYRKNQGIEAN